MSDTRTYTYKLPDGPIVFRFNVPSEPVYDRFENLRRSDESKARAFLVKACIASHSGVELDAIFEKHPAVKHALALICQKEAGAMLEFVEGEVPPS
jgi:hypothetical protein